MKYRPIIKLLVVLMCFAACGAVREDEKISVDAGLESVLVSTAAPPLDITLTVGGEVWEERILPGNRVEDVLNRERIPISPYDMVTPSLETVLKAGDEIRVCRVTKVRENAIEETDYEVVWKNDSSMTIGDTAVTQQGKKGLEEKVWIVTYTDGAETDRKLISQETKEKARNKIISAGTKIAFGKPEGLKYERKYENVRAVSYFFSGNPHGAYGLPCEYGTVAVDRDLIPLGSLLYIEGYGYAIANDVGSAIKGKTVDLYMETYDQCVMWGSRRTTVYVIEDAYQSDR